MRVEPLCVKAAAQKQRASHEPELALSLFFLNKQGLFELNAHFKKKSYIFSAVNWPCAKAQQGFKITL